MKNEIANIINLEGLIKGGSHLDVSSVIPPKGSFVKLIPIEHLDKGIKVLIEGKLFIAYIEGKIPVKEEIIAVVTNTKPLSLSLSSTEFPKVKEESIIDNVIKIFELANKKSLRNTISKVLNEELVLIKSNIVTLNELRKFIKADGLELSLLMNLVWKNRTKSQVMIEDLFEKLFDVKFEEICELMFNSVQELLFSNLPNFIRQQIVTEFIYEQKNTSFTPLIGKEKSILKIIKMFNEYASEINCELEDLIEEFVKNGTKYILQKSVLKEYDYFPDFVIIKHKNELSHIQYNIKKIYHNNELFSYKIIFKHSDLPFELKGTLRNNLLLGKIELDDEKANESIINSFQEDLFEHWGFNSDIKINDKTDDDFSVSKSKTKLNKLVS